MQCNTRDQQVLGADQSVQIAHTIVFCTCIACLQEELESELAEADRRAQRYRSERDRSRSACNIKEKELAAKDTELKGKKEQAEACKQDHARSLQTMQTEMQSKQTESSGIRKRALEAMEECLRKEEEVDRVHAAWTKILRQKVQACKGDSC